MCIAAQGFAETETVDGVEWSYSVSNGAAIVTAANPASGDLVFPDTLGGVPVTGIASNAFANCNELMSVDIPDGMASIGKNAFENCNGLTAVHIHDLSAWCRIKFENYAANPIYYAQRLFLNGEEQDKLVIPDDVTALPFGTFYGYTGMAAVTIPDSVTNIGKSAFRYCSGLTNVAIPSSVTTIREYAFSYCNGLTSMTIPEAVASIGERAFEYCDGMTSVTIPGGVANIGSNAFYSCEGLQAVHIRDLSTWCRIAFKNYTANPVYYAKHLFLNGEEVRDVEIPGDVTALKFGVFYGFTELRSVTVPGSVTNIGKSAFCHCSGMTSAVLAEGVKTLGHYAFAHCSGLTALCIPDSVESVGTKTFLDCEGLRTLFVPGAWEGTTMLESAAVPSGCKIVYGEPSLVIHLTGVPGNLVDVGEEVLVRAEAEYASGDVEYKWEGDAPGSGEGGVFGIDTGAAGGPYTLTCTAVDEAGETAEAEVTFRIAVRYSIAIAADIENGSVRADRERAEEGETVVLTAVPESGYRFVEFLVNGRAIAGNTFTMPGRDVVVSATFEEKLDYARLPFVGEDTPYSGPWGNEAVNGMTASGVGNYSDGSAKFDWAGRLLQIKFVGRPGVLRYGIRGNGTDGLRPSTFLVQESADGIEWRVLARHVSGENLFSGKRMDMSCELSSDTRQVRFYYEDKDAGNVGIYDVYISAGEGELGVGFDREEGFEVETGSEAEITATARNGRKPYEFWWEIDGEGARGGEGGTFTIPGTLGEGPHRVAATVTDADGDTARGKVGFTVTGLAPRYAVSIAGDVGHGTVSADKAEAKEGETVTLSAKAEDGYRFAAFLVDGEDISGNTFTMPAVAVVVSARFEKKSGEVFEKIWGLDEIGEGEYVLAGSDAKGTHAAVAQLVGAVTVLAVEDVAPEGDAIDSPKATLVWTVARRGEGWTIHNDAVGYLGYEGEINSATAEETASEASTWTFSEVAAGGFKVSNVGTPGRTLRYNPQSPRFACYTSDTMTNIELFKRRGNGAGEGVFIGGLAVSGGMLSFDAPEGAFTVEGSTNLLDKGAWRIVEGAEMEEGRVVVPLEGEYGVFRVAW